MTTIRLNMTQEQLAEVIYFLMIAAMSDKLSDEEQISARAYVTRFDETLRISQARDEIRKLRGQQPQNDRECS